MIEGTLLMRAEVHERYGYAKPTREQAVECEMASDIKLYREVWGAEYTSEVFRRAIDLGEQARADMRAGVPVAESEAAQEMIRQHAIQPPRLKKHTHDYSAFIAGLDSRIPEIEFDDSKE